MEKRLYKIRIGNDIRLAVDLRLFIDRGYLLERHVYQPRDNDFENLDSNIYVNKNTEVYYPNQYTEGEFKTFTPATTPVTIHSVKAFLVNTSREREILDDLKNKTRFISRFPIEPTLEAFSSTPYDICCSGYPTWRAYPRNYAPNHYTGFGLHPCWDGIYKPLPHRNDVEYRAQVYATGDLNVVEVSFPAKAQLYTGKYKLIVVAKLYAPGFNKTNLKTITVDMSDVFELVSSSEEGIDTGIAISVNPVIDILPPGEYPPYSSGDGTDVYVNSGSFLSGNILLGRTDNNTVNVDLSEVTEWYEEG